MESGSVWAGAITQSKVQLSSSDGSKTQDKLPKDQEKQPGCEQLTPGPDACSNKENTNNSAHQTGNTECNKDESVTHYQYYTSACGDKFVPVHYRQESGHDVQGSPQPSKKYPGNVAYVQGDHAITTTTNSKVCLAFDADGCGNYKDLNSGVRGLPVIKMEKTGDEPAIYNDIAMDPSSSHQNNKTPNPAQHTAGSITTNAHCSKTKQIIQNNQQGGKPQGENTQILLVYVEETNNESAQQVDDNREAKQIKTSASGSNLAQGVIIKNEESASVHFNKPCIVKQEVMENNSSYNLEKAQPKEHNEQMEICPTTDRGNDRNAASSASDITAGITKTVTFVQPICENKQASSGQQVIYAPGTNKPMASDVFKDPNKHLREPMFDGTGRQTGENTMLVLDHSSSNSRLAKPDSVISQFNMFPTEKDVMAAVYQNTAETSHLTSNSGFMITQSNSTSVVSTHSGCSSYILNDFQPSSSYPGTQGSHSKWFANQVNLAAALCVANNSNYQDVQGSSPLIPQRSPQQRNMLSPTYQKDFSQFVLQSPKPSVHGNQTISPSMLCSPSTNLFDTLMYQSENPFSPTGSRSDTSRGYSSVQDLDELMSAHHMQQSVYQSRQAPIYLNSSAHPDNQQANRSQDMNWNSMNQPTSLPGVGSLLSSNQGRPSGGNTGQPPYKARERFVGNSALPNMDNVAVENVRQQKDANNIVMEEYTATQYQEMLQKHDAGQVEDNRNWNAAPHEERECQGQGQGQNKSRPRKQNISESNSAPHLAGKQLTPGGKGTKRSHSNTDNNSSTPSSAKKACEIPPEEDSKGYVNYQIASTIHTLKPRHIVSWYIDFLIKENENITDMSHSYSIPAGIFDDRDFYFMDSFLKRTTFPTKKFANWMQANFPSINIDAIDFSEGRRKTQNYIVDEAKYWSERTQADIINEVFYHFQTVRDQK